MKKRIKNPVNIIAVKNVQKTSKLLIKLFDWKSVHGGNDFDILMSKENVPTLMLHEFEAHEHNRFKDIHKSPIGIGQSLYVFTEKIENLYKKIQKNKLEIVEELFLNENSQTQEFTFKIEDGHQFSVCENNKWLYYNLP